MIAMCCNRMLNKEGYAIVKNYKWEEEVIINVHNGAMIELPFINLENAIMRNHMEV